MPAVRNALILCTGNSARSILAEALINHLGAPRWRAFSAGSKPAGKVNPYALLTLESHNIIVTDGRSKSWDEFALLTALKMDLVITVCDNAANETCPIWPGAPLTAHWGLDDPAAAQGDVELRKAFESAYRIIRHRVEAFVALDFDEIPAAQIAAELKRIGTLSP